VAVVTVGVAATAAAAGREALPATDVAKTTIAGTIPSSTTAAPAPTTGVTPSTASGPSTVPAGSIRLVDDTRRIQVTVPSSWTDRETAPQMADDGSDRPKITASPDIAAMNAGWSTPGVWFGVVPGPADPAAWLRSYAFSSQCSRGPSEPFDNGKFAGTKDTWTNCGGGSTQIVQVGARTADGSSGVFVQIQVPGPGEPWLAGVLDSLDIVPGAALTPAPQPVNLATVSTVGPADETLVPPVVPADAVRYVDDTGRIAMSLPAAFVDISTAAGVNNDASLRPALAGSPDIDAYYSRWDAGGIEAVVLPAVDPATLLANRDQPCDDGGVRPYSNARFSGLVQTWHGCGATQTRVVQFALTPADQSVTVLVYAQLPDADNTPLAAVLGSLELL
jgi:hypothetical protein